MKNYMMMVACLLFSSAVLAENLHRNEAITVKLAKGVVKGAKAAGSATVNFGKSQVRQHVQHQLYEKYDLVMKASPAEKLHYAVEFLVSFFHLMHGGMVTGHNGPNQQYARDLLRHALSIDDAYFHLFYYALLTGLVSASLWSEVGQREMVNLMYEVWYAKRPQLDQEYIGISLNLAFSLTNKTLAGEIVDRIASLQQEGSPFASSLASSLISLATFARTETARKRAAAKIDFRLVPDDKAEALAGEIKQFSVIAGARYAFNRVRRFVRNLSSEQKESATIVAFGKLLQTPNPVKVEDFSAWLQKQNPTTQNWHLLFLYKLAQGFGRYSRNERAIAKSQFKEGIEALTVEQINSLLDVFQRHIDVISHLPNTDGYTQLLSQRLSALTSQQPHPADGPHHV